jgi:hypothetical protein
MQNSQSCVISKANQATFSNNTNNDNLTDFDDLHKLHGENKALFDGDFLKQNLSMLDNYTKSPVLSTVKLIVCVSFCFVFGALDSEDCDLMNDEYDCFDYENELDYEEDEEEEEEDIDLFRGGINLNLDKKSTSSSSMDKNSSSLSSASNNLAGDKKPPTKSYFTMIDEVMLKVYEEEENLTLALEQAQDKELRSVIAQEFKLSKQLSVEKLKQYNTDTDLNDTEIEDFDLSVIFVFSFKMNPYKNNNNEKLF